MSRKAGTALRKMVSLGAALALAASLVPASALTALADNAQAQAAAASQSANTSADDTMGETAGAGASVESYDSGSGADADNADGGTANDSTNTDGVNSDTTALKDIVRADMTLDGASAADAIEMVSANVGLATDDTQATPTVFAYCGLNFVINAEAENTVSFLGWSGHAPEGALSIPSQITMGGPAGVTYTVTRITSSALPEKDPFDADISDFTRATLYAESVAAAGMAPGVTAITIPSTVTKIDTAAFAAYPSLRTIECEADGAFASHNGALFTSDFTQLLLVPEGFAGELTLPRDMKGIAPAAVSRARSLTALEADPEGFLVSHSGALYSTDGATLLAAPAGRVGTLTLAPTCTTLAEGSLYTCVRTTAVVASSQIEQIALAITDANEFMVSMPALPDGVLADPEDAGDADSAASEGDTATTDAGNADNAATANNDTAATDPATTDDNQYVPMKAIVPAGSNAIPWETAKAQVEYGTAPGVGATADGQANQLSYTLTSNYSLEVSWNGEPGTAPSDLKVPAMATIDGQSYPVTSVAPYGFVGQTSITSVILPDAITTIGEGAFLDCSALVSIMLPDSLSRISAKALKGTAVSTLVIPQATRYIGAEALSTMAPTTIITLGAVSMLDPQAVIGAEGISVYTQADALSAWQSSIGLPVAGNHIYTFAIGFGQSAYSLETGQSVNLFDGGDLQAPGGTRLSWAYRAKSVNVTSAGVMEARAMGTTQVTAAIELTVGLNTYKLASANAQVSVTPSAAELAAQAEAAQAAENGAAESTIENADDPAYATDLEDDYITKQTDPSDVSSNINQDLPMVKPAEGEGETGNAANENGSSDTSNATDPSMNAEAAGNASSPSSNINTAVPLTPVGEKPVALIGRVFTGKATPSGKAEDIVTDITLATRNANAQAKAANTNEQSDAEIAQVEGEAARNVTSVGANTTTDPIEDTGIGASGGDTAVVVAGDAATDPGTTVVDYIWYSYRVSSSTADGGEIYISQYADRRPSGSITLPSTVKIDNKMYTVVGIDGVFDDLVGSGAKAGGGFCACSDLTSVTIPATVREILYGAFSYCYGLTAVEFAPDSKLHSLGNDTFEACSSLTKFKLPPELKTIPSSALAVPARGFGPFILTTSLAEIDASENKYFYTASDGSLYSGPEATYPNCFIWAPIPDEVNVRQVQYGTTALGHGALLGTHTKAEVVPSTVTYAGMRTIDQRSKDYSTNEALALSPNPTQQNAWLTVYSLSYPFDLYYVLDSEGKSTWSGLTGQFNQNVNPSLNKIPLTLQLDKSAIALGTGSSTTESIVATTPFEKDSAFLDMVTLKLVDASGNAADSLNGIALTNTGRDGNKLKANITVSNDIDLNTLNNFEIALAYDSHNGVDATACANNTCAGKCDHGMVMAKASMQLSPASGWLPTVACSGTGENITFNKDDLKTEDNTTEESRATVLGKWTFSDGTLTITCPTGRAIADLGWVTLADPSKSNEMGDNYKSVRDGDKYQYQWTHWGPLRSRVTKIVMASDLKAVNMNAWFRGMGIVNDVEGMFIPEGVEEVAFSFCWMRSVTQFRADMKLPASVKIARDTFGGCDALTRLPDDFITERNTNLTSMNGFAYRSGITSLGNGFVLPSNLLTLENAFMYNQKLASLPSGFVIPSKVTNMSGAFLNCVSLTALPSSFAIPESVALTTNVFSVYADCSAEELPMCYDGKDSNVINLNWTGMRRIFITSDTPVDGKVVLQTASFANGAPSKWDRQGVLTLGTSGEKQGTIVEPAAPDRTDEGLVFTLWYADEECTKPIDFNEPIVDQVEPSADEATKGAYVLYGAYRTGLKSDGTSADGGKAASTGLLKSTLVDSENLISSGTNWWSIDSSGTLYIRGCGTIDSLWGSLSTDGVAGSSYPEQIRNAFANKLMPNYWHDYEGSIKSIQMMPSVNAVDTMYWFANLSSATTFSGKMPVSCTDATCMFINCKGLTALPDGFTVSGLVKSTQYMLGYTTALKELPAGFVLPNGLKNCGGMFSHAGIATLPEGFIVPSTVTSCSWMFESCGRLVGLPVGFTIPEGSNFEGMFFQNGSLETLPVGFKIPAPISGKTYRKVFETCSSLSVLPDEFDFDPEIAAKSEKWFASYWAPADELKKLYYFGDNPNVLNYDWPSQNRLLITTASSVDLTVKYMLMQEDGTYAEHAKFMRAATESIPQLAAVDDGHGFIGWATDEACTQAFDFNAYAGENGVTAWKNRNSGANELVLYGKQIIAGTYHGVLTNGIPLGQSGTNTEGDLELTADSPTGSAAWWYITKDGELVIDGKDAETAECTYSGEGDTDARYGELVKLDNGTLVPYAGADEFNAVDPNVKYADAKDDFGRKVPTNRYTKHPTIAASNFPDWKFDNAYPPRKWTTSAWGPYRSMIKSAFMNEGLYAESTGAWFKDTGARHVDAYITDRTYEAGEMFAAYLESASLESINGDFRMPKDGVLVNMKGIFRGQKNLLELPKGVTVPETVKELGVAFQDMRKLTVLPDGFRLSKDLVAPDASKDLQFLFSGCASLKALPDGFEIPEGIENLRFAFASTGLESLPNSLKIPQSATTTRSMFANSSLSSLPEGFEFMFNDTGDRAAALDVSDMFSDCTSLTYIPESFDLSKFNASSSATKNKIIGKDTIFNITKDDYIGEGKSLTTYLAGGDDAIAHFRTTDDLSLDVGGWFEKQHRKLTTSVPDGEYKVQFFLPLASTDEASGTVTLEADTFASESYITVVTSTINDVEHAVPINSGLYYEGYLFNGWYTDSTLAKAFDFSKSVTTQGMTATDNTYKLYAKYVKLADKAPLPAIKLDDGTLISEEEQAGAGATQYAWWYIDRDATLHIEAAEGYAVNANKMKSQNSDAEGSGFQWDGDLDKRGYWVPQRAAVRSIDSRQCKIVGSLDSWFKSFTALTNITFLELSEGITGVNNMLVGCTSLTAVPAKFVIPEGVQGCGDLFRNCTSLKNIADEFALPSTATSFKSFFQGCISLTTVPAGIFTKIPDRQANYVGSIFKGCSSLESIPSGFKLPIHSVAAVTRGSYRSMFEGCSKLVSLPTDFRIPDETTDVSFLFKSCASLTMLPVGMTIPSSVTFIQKMFLGCRSLTALPSGFSIPSAASIGVNVSGGTSGAGTVGLFAGCSSLVSLPASLDLSKFSSEVSTIRKVQLFGDWNEATDTYTKFDSLKTVFAGTKQQMVDQLYPAGGAEGIDLEAKASFVKNFWATTYGRELICAEDAGELEDAGMAVVTLKTRTVLAGEESSAWKDNDEEWETGSVVATLNTTTKEFEFDEPDIEPRYGYQAAGWFTSPTASGTFPFDANGKGYFAQSEPAPTLYATYTARFKATVPTQATIYMQSTGNDSWLPSSETMSNETVEPIYVVGIDTAAGAGLKSMYTTTDSQAKARLKITMNNDTGRAYFAPLNMTYEQVTTNTTLTDTKWQTAFPYMIEAASESNPATEIPVKFELTRPLDERPEGDFTMALTTATWRLSMQELGHDGKPVTH